MPGLRFWMMPACTSFQIGVTLSRLLNWMVALPVAPATHARRTTPSLASTPYGSCESNSGPPLLRRSRRAPFIDRMRSYASPVRQSMRGTLTPVYHTASIVRLSPSAEAGAKAAATVKRSVSAPASPPAPRLASAATAPATTSPGVAASWFCVTSSGMKTLLRSLGPEHSDQPRIGKLRRRLHCRFRLGRFRPRFPAGGGLLDALVVHVARIAVQDDPLVVQQPVDSLNFIQLLLGIVAVLQDRLGQRQRASTDLLQLGHGILQRIHRLELGRRPLDAVFRLRQLAEQHQGVDEPAPGRAAKHRDQRQPSKHLNGVAEAKHARAVRRVVDERKVARQKLVRRSE